MGENIIVLLGYIIIILSIILTPIGFILLLIKSREKEVKHENTRITLVKRYINGEITKEQYEQMNKYWSSFEGEKNNV